MVPILKFFIYPLSLLPLPVLYFFARFWQFFFFRILGYRRSVVEKNIARALPHLSPKEQRKTVKGFYAYFSQLIAEAIKSFTMSEENATRRMKILNPEVANQFYADKRNIVLIFGHFNNWEWPGLGSRSQLKHNPASIFKPIKNKAMNAWILQNRERFGNILMSMEETKDYYESQPKEITINAFISDQNPRNASNAIWLDFLGIKSAFLRGPAVFAQTYDMPVVFADIQQVKKGYYEATLELITASPKEMSEEQIITSFANKLEQQILDNPSRWLWSHKRWKHDYEKFMAANQ